MRKAEKRTEYITFRADAATKAALENISEEKKWSISQVVEEIVKDWLKTNGAETSDKDRS